MCLLPCYPFVADSVLVSTPSVVKAEEYFRRSKDPPVVYEGKSD